jgi:hypothetical protein
MLEGLKGDAGEVTRLSYATTLDRDSAAGPGQPGQLPEGTSVRRLDPTAMPNDAVAAGGARRPAVLAGPRSIAATTVGARLRAAYGNGRPDGQPWTARTLAEAAGCGRSSAASFLQRQRPAAGEHHR